MKLLVFLFLAGCSAPIVQTPPTCLNVHEGDRHVEFDGRNLRLAEEGSPRSLPIESGDEVRCERLEILRNARVASVLIEYSTKGDRKVGIATIRDARWFLKPLASPYALSKDAAGKTVITLTDSKTGAQRSLTP
jgi:hypothetical protein